jgi:DNA-binding NtrC family response regulator
VHDTLERLVASMLDGGIRFADAREEFERRFIVAALARSASLGDAAALLGLHRNSLARKLAEYRIARPRGRRAAGRPAGAGKR